MQVKVFIIVGDTPEQKNIEVGMFFDEASAGSHLTTLVGGWINLRLIPRMQDVTELHEEHRSMFLSPKPDTAKAPAARTGRS